MPRINVVYWNIQNFGNSPVYKADYGPLCRFIAHVAVALQADILCIQELKGMAITAGYLSRLQQELCALPAPWNNWYYDWIKGAVRNDGAAVAPYATAADLDWDDAHHEGYALFWNQNIAKFKVQASPPIGGVANTQSETVRSRAVMFGPNYGFSVPAGGIPVPAGATPYILPAGTMAPPGIPITDPATGAVVLAAGALLGANTPVSAGTVLPLGTAIGPAGVQLNAVVLWHNPVAVPGNYTLTEPLTLPAGGTTLVPEHSLSLVLEGRDTGGATFVGDISGGTANFNPGGPNVWTNLRFTRGAIHPAVFAGSRRPAFFTVDVNRNPMPGPAGRLVPITMYHAPSAAVAAAAGMQRASYSRPLYQVYDPAAGAWIDSAFAVLGGDMNVRVDAIQYAYDAFHDPFAAGGANCQVRVYHPAPPPTPANPAPTRADNILNKSTAQINAPPVGGAPIVMPATNDYRRMAIDNVFYRGFGPLQAPAPAPAALFDLLQAVTGAAGPFNIQAGAVAAFLNIPAFNQTWNVAWGLAPGPAPALPALLNPDDFVWELATGTFTTPLTSPPARRAAEFIHLCVSDHLPVLFTMDL